MISICTDSYHILSALQAQENCSEYIKEYIKLYLASYGTHLSFQEFFLQINDETGDYSAVILRYNNQIYITASQFADLPELASFISGFSDCTVFSDTILKTFFTDYDVCYEMLKTGVQYDKSLLCINQTDDSKAIADLVTDYLESDERLDYYLNLSHQMRHGVISAYAYYNDSELASVVIKSDTEKEISIITGVYTKDYFRGNGYAKEVLEYVSCDINRKYLLICEEHNINFYLKCGFSVAGTCIRIHM